MFKLLEREKKEFATFSSFCTSHLKVLHWATFSSNISAFIHNLHFRTINKKTHPFDMSHTHFMFIVFMFLVRSHKSLAADTAHATRWISDLQPGSVHLKQPDKSHYAALTGPDNSHLMVILRPTKNKRICFFSLSSAFLFSFSSDECWIKWRQNTLKAEGEKIFNPVWNLEPSGNLFSHQPYPAAGSCRCAGTLTRAL